MASTIELRRESDGTFADVFDWGEVGRAKATPKNPHGVAVGQTWTKTDSRPYRGHHEHYFQVLRVNLRRGVATVVTPFVSKSTREIKLTRFSRAHHYRLATR